LQSHIWKIKQYIPYVNYAYPSLKFLWEGKLCSSIYTLVFHLNSWFIGSSVWNHLVLQLVIMRYFPHLWLITRFVTSATWQVPHMEQGPHTFHENLSSPAVFRGVHIARSVFSMYCFVRHCVPFHLVIVLSALVSRFTADDYPFSIIKIFRTPL
jgi:hypothetical protein